MNLTSTNWHIITGSPSSGKRSTLDSIAYRGYKTIPEAARVFIDEEISRTKTIKEIRTPELEFQEHVLKMKIEIESSLNPNELIFFNRGILDSIPFMKLAGATSNRLETVTCNRAYKNVFLLEPLPYINDYARVENPEQASLIGELLFKTYSVNGYNVIKVPVMPISTRVDYILMHIENDKNI